MLPVLFRIGGLEVATHDVFVMGGVAVAVAVFRREARSRGASDPRLWTIVACSLLAGAVAAKLGTGWRYLADHPDPSLWGLWLEGGKSLLGGLAGAYLGALVGKRLVGYPYKTGDLFAPAVTLGIAVGRVGCFLTEPIGTPTSLPWGITLSPATGAQVPGCPQCAAGVPLHPSFLYEIVFLLALYGLLRTMAPRVRVPGELFKVFLLAYGVFRFVVEFVRGHEAFAFGLTGSQVFLVATMPVLIGYFCRQIATGAYRPATALVGPAPAASPP